MACEGLAEAEEPAVLGSGADAADVDSAILLVY